MKEYIIRALYFMIGTMIGLAIISLVNGEEIDWLKLILYGLIMGIVDFVISMISWKVRKNKVK